MATQSWSTRVRHDSDATFREWGNEFKTKLAAVGLTQTADTGQIDWTTVTRPGTNTDAGYEIWEFADAMHATAPIFLRVDYGTGTSATFPSIKIRAGTGSNGSGTLTGSALTSLRSINGGAAQTTNTARQSYMCHAEGFFGVNWKTGAGNTEGSFLLARTVDSNGDPTATGALASWGTGQFSNSVQRQALRYAAAAGAHSIQTTATDGMLGFFAQNQGSSVVGSDLQVALAFTWTPRMEPLVGICGVYPSEVATGSTFSVALVGTTARTYIGLSDNAGTFSSNANGGSPKIAMLWE